MNFENDFKNAIDRYNERLKIYGPTQEALGWGKKGRANLRFEVLLSEWNFDNSSLLDFGCGFGDLINYMDAKGIQSFRYTGIDINESLIEIAKSKHPHHTFLCDNILEKRLDEKYDFIVSSGVFNHMMSDNIFFIGNCFDIFSKLAVKGFAVNFLSDKVEYKDQNLYYSSPSDILNLAYKYSNNVILKNDYMPYEFTIFVNLHSKVDKDYTVYEEYTKFL